MKDGIIATFSITNNGTAIQVDTQDLILCKHCHRQDTIKCPFFFTDACFKPSDNFYCALGVVAEDE